MILDDSEFPACQWLSRPGPMNTHVISCRIRLARNLKGYPFSHWASTGELAKVISLCSGVIRQTSLMSDAEELQLEGANDLDLHFLMERHQISQEMARGQNQRSVFIQKTQTLSIMVAEEDHLRLQVLLPGLNLQEAWRVISGLDDEIGNALPYAFSDRLGYLTACPTNVGTGMRCSVMVHLPALVMTRQIQKLINAVSQLGLTVRGPQGEGSDIQGNLFQLSNQVTLGISESETLEKLFHITEQIVDSERKATTQLLEEAEEEIQDRVWRSYGILTTARKLNSRETLDLLSPIRLGVTTGTFKEVSLDTLNEIFLCSRPAHLQKKAGKTMESRDRDIYRARFIQSRLKSSNN
ncbi:MAG: protein arginine kinase [Candidatus Omnitrophica bacterium COP1]|nr:protein arginine kinase [bacterium]MBK7493928.1 protein arginine kinase [Candidatus Omnitrophota bacterium]MCE7906959.1 protein arginine kinase [Candidatus Omnitrophica bacterium COP1]